MRGEDHRLTIGKWVAGGSPPHARGRQEEFSVSSIAIGITPACAGKTLPLIVFCRRIRDHPRMRGEDRTRLFAGIELHGSPPHARGRHNCRWRRRRTSRITPACAGKTLRAEYSESTSPDHPRMRGEDQHLASNVFLETGSPPHARGRRSGARRGSYRQRITPACAGKTVIRTAFARKYTDHPRMRGEDCDMHSPTLPPAGSPPHARGRRPALRSSSRT